MRLEFTGFCTLWLMWLSLGSCDEPKVFCYYRGSVIEKDGHSKLEPSGIDPTLCTHVIYLAVTAENGDVGSSRSEEDFPKFNALRKQNEKLKTLLAVEGLRMSEIMEDPALRPQYIRGLIGFMLRHEFDGVSIIDASLMRINGTLPNYNLHLKEIRETLNEYNLDRILSITLKASEADAKLNQNIPELSQDVDFILLIMPLFSPKGTTTSHISPLYPSSRDTTSWELSRNTNATIQFWLNGGAAAEKLILGTFFGGVTYTLNNSAEHVPGSPSTIKVGPLNEAPMKPYHELCQMISQDSWTTVWDAEQRVPYGYAGNEWMTYENVRSLTEKAEYAKARGLGGVMAYIINSDDYRGHCGERYPLLKALNCGLYKRNCTSGTVNKTTSGSVGTSPMEAKILCYYDGTAANRIGYAKLRPSEIDPRNCTHLIYASLRLTANGNPGSARWLDLSYRGGRGGFQKFNALRKRNEKLKTLLSTRAWHEDSMSYSKIYADSSLRSEYVKKVVEILRQNEFDGFFINWIYPNSHGSGPDDVQNFVLLLKELRTSFDEYKLILSTTVRGSERYARSFYDIPQIAKYVDFITLIGEYHLPLDPIQIHLTAQYPTTKETSGLDWASNYHASIKYWLKQGAPAEKIILGTQFIGLRYSLNNSTVRLLRSPANIPADINDDLTILGYNEICRLTSQDVWATGWNEEQHLPYSHSGIQWITYDNVRSLAEKGRYAKSMGLGGVMAWSIDQDDHRGDCGERYPLLNALSCGLREINCTLVSTSQTTTSRSIIPDHADEDAKRTCASSNIKYVRHPQNCARFWICRRINEKEYHAEPFSCAAGLYFDKRNVICRSKNLVECD